VHTNDPANRRVQLHVSANLEVQLESAPKRLWFDRISDSNPVNRTLSLEGTKIDTVKITDIRVETSVPEGTYTWKLNDGRPRGLRSITLDVTFHPDKIIPGKFNHTLVIETDLKIAPLIKVRLNGEVLGPLSFEPSRVLFGNFQIGEPVEKDVIVRANSGKKFSIEKLNSLDDEVTVTLKDKGVKTEHVLKIRFVPAQNRERLQTRIHVVTSLVDETEMYLDIHGFRKRQAKQMTPHEVY